MPVDKLGRPHRSLRISVTDRCNIRCSYCMPEETYQWLPRDSILSFEEIERLVSIFTRQGVRKLRITGGEPLMRRGLDQLIEVLKSVSGVEEIALTTNGILLSRDADILKRSGLDRVTVSLDTLDASRFREFTRSAKHADVLAAIARLGDVGFVGTKINTVVTRGFNDDEISDLIEFGRSARCEVRFIEYMDVGGATRWSMDQVVTRSEILEILQREYGEIGPISEEDSSRPAQLFRLPDGLQFGIIASTTTPFCATCDRSRLTADGMWLRCLYADTGTDLKVMLRRGDSDDEIARAIETGWIARRDRGAEERLAVSDRDVLYQVGSLRSDPHREMHTRGG